MGYASKDVYECIPKGQVEIYSLPKAIEKSS